MPNTIVTKGSGIRKERIAEAAISPGMLMQVIANDNVQPHAVAGAPGQGIAVEYEVYGRAFDDDYAAGDLVFYETLMKGSEFQGYIAAAAAALTRGTFLQSDGAGGFVARTGTNVAIAVLLEDVDNSGAGTGTRASMEQL